MHSDPGAIGLSLHVLQFQVQWLGRFTCPWNCWLYDAEEHFVLGITQSFEAQGRAERAHCGATEVSELNRTVVNQSGGT